ncbi:MAG: cache domain-containing protein, partial [Deltaproteobacteria bacterium]|nr:cache domain-containing protein [Deltaproteobacteria bacterium]
MDKTDTDSNGYKPFRPNLRISIWLTTAAVITLILILALTVNYAREKDIVEQFSRQQVAIARGAATGIKDLISSVEKSMIIISRLPSCPPCSYVTEITPETTRQSIKVIYDDLGGDVEFIVVENKDGVVTAEYPPSIFKEITDESLKRSPYLHEIRETGKTYIGDVELAWKGAAEDRVQSVIVAVPKYDAEDNFSGVVLTG